MTKLPGGVPQTDTATIERLKRGTGTYPWQNPHRRDVAIQLNMKQPERFMLMLNWLSAQSGRTKREMVEDALHDYLRREMGRHGVPFE